MPLGEGFQEQGTRANGHGIILIPADAQHTTGVQKLTPSSNESMNGLLGAARGAGPGLGAGKERKRPRARPGGEPEETGIAEGPTPPRSGRGVEIPDLRLGAGAGLGARLWELGRPVSGRSHSPLPSPGCACWERPPLSSRRTRRTHVPALAAVQPEMKSRHPPPVRSSPFAAL